MQALCFKGNCMGVETGAMLIAILALIWQMHQNNKQAKLNFFTTYTQRYQDIVEKIGSSLAMQYFIAVLRL